MSDGRTNNSYAARELHRIYMEKTMELLPLIILMAILGVVGIVGNIVTILFYSKKQRQTQTIFLIKALAITDLIVCVLFVPNIAEMAVNVMYTSVEACKIMHFLGHWAVESSGLILGFIAFDRYWKICGAFKNEIKNDATIRIVIGIVVFSCLMSIRDLVYFDVVKTNLNRDNHSIEVIGHFCSNSNNPDLKWSVLVFHGIDAITFLAIFIIIILTYSKVLWTLSQLNKHVKQKMSPVRSCKKRRGTVFISNTNSEQDFNTENTDAEDSSDVNRKVPDIIDDHPQKSHDMLRVPSVPYKSSMTSLNSNKPKTEKCVKWNKDTMIRNKKIRRSERNVTMLMFAVSTAFFLCAAPYFVVRIGLKALEKDEGGFELGLLFQFGLRLGYINSVLNPLIYTLFNPSFRRHARRILMCAKGALSAIVTQTSMTSEQPSLSKASKVSDSDDNGLDETEDDMS